MTRDTVLAIRAIADQFENADIYPTDMALQRGQGFDPRVNGRSVTFSRYNWTNDTHETLAISGSERGSIRYLIRFRINTLATIGLGEAVPQEEEIPEEKVVATIAIGFVIEYVLPTNPADIDSRTLSIIEKVKVVRDVWPFWREALQSLALRARLPIPMLPTLRARAMMPVAPDGKQRATKRKPSKKPRTKSDNPGRGQ